MPPMPQLHATRWGLAPQRRATLALAQITLSSGPTRAYLTPENGLQMLYRRLRPKLGPRLCRGSGWLSAFGRLYKLWAAGPQVTWGGTISRTSRHLKPATPAT